ncbi:T9SS type A sorting domain-containing protein [Rurimicrobium arvi]|uniref:Por secretion system C-terminal sorting domain-containing protein n=1 Tax=Rurimicrobium arvi TaxID=2049916 RepID=A0ABP8MZ39_9BACT
MKNHYSAYRLAVTFGTVLLLNSINIFAQLPSVLMPRKSRPDMFTFYEDNNVNMPAGSNLVSKSVVYLHGVSPSLPNSDIYGSSTFFLIRTFRDDDFVCACMTGHQVKTLNGGLVPTVPSDIDISNVIAMNYKSRDVYYPGDPSAYVGPHEAASAYLSDVHLVSYFYEPVSGGTGNDAALVLIDKRQLPSAAFATLGYDFSTINSQTTQSFFTISHPLSYPQRLSNNLLYDEDANNWVDFRFQKPFAEGPGSSGAPLVNSSTISAQGILAAGVNQTLFSEMDVGGRMEDYTYETMARFTRMSLLESAIKEHCWKNANKAEIQSLSIYKQSVEVSNANIALLRSRDAAIASATDISGSSASFTGTSINGKKVTQLTANNCTIGSFALPVVYPGTTATPWRVVVSANQVDVNAGFSYAASGISEMDLTTIETYTRSATSRLADAAADTASNSSDGNSGVVSGFKLFPNPSPDGIFFLELPAAEKDVVYTGSVMSVDGKLLQQLDHMQGGTKVSFNLSQQPRGMYLLNVHDPEGRLVFTTKITWQ